LRFRFRKHYNYILPSKEVLFDGRILGVLKTNIFAGKIVLPEFLINYIDKTVREDKSDSARRGKMVVESLLQRKTFKVKVDKTKPRKVESIDKKLIKLALLRNYRVMAVNDELSQFSRMIDVKIIKLSEIEKALKQAFFKGDILSVKPFKTGKRSGEGVAYLDDNSKIVIEGASALLGKVVRCKIESILELPKGRIIFSTMEKKNQRK
jgi:uncharacterized protein YacL